MKPAETNQLKTATSGAVETIIPEIVSETLAGLRGLCYGSIVVTILDSKVVQSEKNEKAICRRRREYKSDDPSTFPRELILISLLSQDLLLCTTLVGRFQNLVCWL